MPPKKTKPNKPCPCGSGKKHKKCCMMKDQMTAGARGGNGGRGTTARIPSAVAASTPRIEMEAETGMNTDINSGTNIIADADLSRIILLLESEEEDGVQRFRAGGSSHARSGGNRNTPNTNSENENEDKKGTTAVTSSSTGTDDDDDNGGGSTGYTTKKYPRTPSPNNNSENENEEKKATVAVTSSSTGTDDDDNGGGSTGYTKKKYLRTPSSSPLPVTSSTVTTGNATENVEAALLPFPSLSLMTLSEVQTEDAALVAMTTASPPLPPAGANAAKLPPPPPPPPQQTSIQASQEECVLCAYPLPINGNESFYFSCCGETICNGCIVGQDRVRVIGTNVELPIKDSKEEKREFLKSLLSEVPMPCPFCRAEVPDNTEESSERLLKRINKYKDPEAMVSMGFNYMMGEHGLTKNLAKAEELFKQAYDLGHPNAAYLLVRLYSDHIPDQARKMKYLEQGALRGHPACMLEMAGCVVESNPPNFELVVLLTMDAAYLGEDDAIQHLMVCYQCELLSKDDLAATLRAHKAANDKGKSEPREYAKRRKDFEEKLIARGNLRRK